MTTFSLILLASQLIFIVNINPIAALDNDISDIDLGDPQGALVCHLAPRLELSEDCAILKGYDPENFTLYQTNFGIARQCACELSNMEQKWYKSFPFDDTNRLGTLIQWTLDEYPETKPPISFWRDSDLTALGISIQVASRDYVRKIRDSKFKAQSDEFRLDMANEDVWRLIVRFCGRVARDRLKLFRYLENLSRINPVVFFRLLEHNPFINSVYVAARACKLPMLYRLDEYKTLPDEEYFVDRAGT